jgi:hypothetical protein
VNLKQKLRHSDCEDCQNTVNTFNRIRVVKNRRSQEIPLERNNSGFLETTPPLNEMNYSSDGVFAVSAAGDENYVPHHISDPSETVNRNSWVVGRNAIHERLGVFSGFGGGDEKHFQNHVGTTSFLETMSVSSFIVEESEVESQRFSNLIHASLL